MQHEVCWNLAGLGKVAVFNQEEAAQECVDALTQAGVPRQQIYMVSEALHRKRLSPASESTLLGAFLGSVLGVGTQEADRFEKFEKYHDACQSAIQNGKTLVIVERGSYMETADTILRGMEEQGRRRETGWTGDKFGRDINQ